MIRISHLSKIHESNKVAALQDISLQVQDGEWLVLLGESGCGKTTLLQCIAGLLDPSAGAIYLNEERVLGPSEVLVKGHEDIELVHQDLEMFPNHRVRDFLDYKVRTYSPEFQKQQTEFVIELCGLEDFLDRLPHELSGGQQQRCAIAAAMISSPEVLLFDEPFSHLDAATRRELRVLLYEVWRDTGVTILFVTHDANEILGFASRIVVMKSGKVLQDSAPHDVYHRPSSPYVARFFGEFNPLEEKGLKWVRVEDCVPQKEKGFHRTSGVIEGTFFEGRHYRLMVKTTKGTWFMYHASALEVGVAVDIYWDPKRELDFSKSMNP